MNANLYELWLGQDNNLCFPVIDPKRINAIFEEALVRVAAKLGIGPKPTLILDLEHLQVADYGALGGVSAEQRQNIATLHAAEPIRPEELVFLGLRSLFQANWPPPESDDDIRFAAAFDFVLNKILADTALDLAGNFKAPAALLPYWGRLSFLRVMVELPTENIARYGLDNVACALVKRAKFNATTFAFENGPIVGINYALEPILKHLNRYLLHYFGTKDMAGPAHLVRAWEGIIPTILFFWSDVAATQITRSSIILYQDQLSMMAHRLTAEQLDFIFMHELGHVALDHPNRLKAERASGSNSGTLQHEFEFSADSFALGLMRSKLIKYTRGAVDTADKPDNERISRITETLHDYQSGLGGIYLLFTYMDFIQQAGELLKTRLAGRLRVRERMDSHPRASARLERLELTNLGEHLYTSPLERYSRGFFESVLDYASTLHDEALLESVNGSLT